MSADGWRHSFSDQIRYGDLDTNAHLNNVAVHGFFESARIAYMRELFSDLDPLGREGHFGMIFAETHVRYVSPGFYRERVRVDVKVAELRRSSVKLGFQMLCADDGRVIAGMASHGGTSHEAFIAVIPAPGVVLPFAAPMAAQLLRRRR